MSKFNDDLIVGNGSPALAGELLRELGCDQASRFTQRRKVSRWLAKNEPRPILMKSLEDSGLVRRRARRRALIARGGTKAARHTLYRAG